MNASCTCIKLLWLLWCVVVQCLLIGLYTTVYWYTGHHRGVTGIQGKWEWERKRNTRTGTCNNHCYSLVSSQVGFTELYKPSHWYAIVVKFFLLYKALSNKHLCKIVCRLTSFVMYYNYTILLSSLFNTCHTSMLYLFQHLA